MYAFRRLALAVTAALAFAGAHAPAVAQNFDPNANTTLQQLQNQNIDFRQMAIDDLQRQVEVTVPYRISNPPPGITQARISCSFPTLVTTPNGSIQSYPNHGQDIQLSGGSANGSITISGSAPDENFFSNRSTEDIQSYLDIEVQEWRCAIFFNGPDFSNWLYSESYCVNTNMCAGATRNLVEEGQF